MSPLVGFIVAFIIAMLATAYLIVALVNPERF
ncbi:MAG TPA: potassium-transporting ATPase subunit F [Candidatus Binatia bacterium]|nr:potassium-transporting ATPase subunit F [Candidatus Binatia bacterium]